MWHWPLTRLYCRREHSTISRKIITTEKDPAKAAKAREHWNLAGPEVTYWIELHEGDLLENLRIDEDVPSRIDLLLLDSVSISLLEDF